MTALDKGQYLHTDEYYAEKEPKFKDITDPDIIEIYKRISDAIERNGPEFESKFNVIYRLEVSAPADRANDPNYVKFYTVDLKNSRLLLGYASDKNDSEIVLKADSSFITSESDFVRLYYGGTKTAIKFVLKGILKLKGSYQLMVKFYYGFLTVYVKDPKLNEANGELKLEDELDCPDLTSENPELECDLPDF